MAVDPIDPGTAGASARREGDRRRTRRERETRERHPRIGGLLLALRETPAHERAWTRGAEGEEMVAKALEQRCRPEVVVLHDRRIPGSRANIDHIAVAPSGVWVIDPKRYAGRIRVSKPWFGDAKLVIGGRDRTKLVAGLRRQVDLVRAVVEASAPGVEVFGALCFVQGDLPPLRTLTVDGFPLLHRRSLPKRLNADGPHGPEAVAALARMLAREFPPA